MKGEVSAGLVIVRRTAAAVEVLLVHPGGPLWAKKDEGAWSIPKGRVESGEDVLHAALRETSEELGLTPPEPPYVPLGQVRLRSGKTVHAWAARGDVDLTAVRSNEVEIDWPPRTGRKLRIPEIDRATWATPDQAARLANQALLPLFERARSPSVLAQLFPAGPV